ncbi:MAG: thiamine pyrophosphate-binding protein [Chloroflexi bacterium]|nr:MAG: thiamine pyrophosphate-binding protein [Chloroflexota bacterium]
MAGEMNGGLLVGEVLQKQGVRFLYTLCGGHISPILVGAEQQGIRVIDVRHEVTAVFAADATARLTGVPGVAAVTAGPGVTNTITALKNAQMAQSPLVLIGGAAATLLKGRGALQDIDQLSLVKPIVKWARSAKKVRQIVPLLEEAFRVSQEGVPGPVFLEIPIDLLYPEAVVQSWTMASAGKGKGLAGKGMKLFLGTHLRRTFRQAWQQRAVEPQPVIATVPGAKEVKQVKQALLDAKRPLLIVGSQALIDAQQSDALQKAVLNLGIPTYLSGMARGLLGRDALHKRHKRSKALREADVVILAGVPADFRLGYGRSIPRRATYISINRSKKDLTKNRRPTMGFLADPGAFLRMLADSWNPDITQNRWAAWHTTLTERDAARDEEIDQMGQQQTEWVNPVWLCQQLETVIDENSILIGDGGDFVATASYVARPRAPLSWLDPGAFGTLGAGGGFALAAKLCRPEAEVWLLYGDGSTGYSLAEFDTFARHNVAVIAVIGNDASWAQIARDQVEILGTPLGTELAQTDYHLVAEGYGGEGFCATDPTQVTELLQNGKRAAKNGRSALLNVMIGKTDFRKGSISM